ASKTPLFAFRQCRRRNTSLALHLALDLDKVKHVLPELEVNNHPLLRSFFKARFQPLMRIKLSGRRMRSSQLALRENQGGLCDVHFHPDERSTRTRVKRV